MSSFEAEGLDAACQPISFLFFFCFWRLDIMILEFENTL